MRERWVPLVMLRGVRVTEGMRVSLRGDVSLNEWQVLQVSPRE